MSRIEGSKSTATARKVLVVLGSQVRGVFSDPTGSVDGFEVRHEHTVAALTHCYVDDGCGFVKPNADGDDFGRNNHGMIGFHQPLYFSAIAVQQKLSLIAAQPRCVRRHGHVDVLENWCCELHLCTSTCAMLPKYRWKKLKDVPPDCDVQDCTGKYSDHQLIALQNWAGKWNPKDKDWTLLLYDLLQNTKNEIKLNLPDYLPQKPRDRTGIELKCYDALTGDLYATVTARCDGAYSEKHKLGRFNLKTGIVCEGFVDTAFVHAMHRSMDRFVRFFRGTIQRHERCQDDSCRATNAMALDHSRRGALHYFGLERGMESAKQWRH